MAGTLYIVATPIGNLDDMPPRVAATFGAADFIAAEDTRVTMKLLNFLGLKKPMVSYYEHALQKGEGILRRIEAGENCALCSDAGMPCVSDPGEVIVRDALARGIKVVPIPAASACVTALAVSGQDTSRWVFEGFLPVNRKQKKERLAELLQEKRTTIFYEAPHKLRTTLDDLANAFGADRSITLCRELTKLHEEVLRLTLDGAVAYYETQPPRGEYVLIVEGAPKQQESGPVSEEEALMRVQALLAEGLSRKDAVRQVAAETGLAKNQLYDAAKGSDSFLWNGHSTLEADSHFVCLDTHSLQNAADNIKRTQYFNLLTWCWEQMSNNRGERVLLVCDEAYLMIDPQVPQSLVFLRNVEKRARKYEAGLAIISHSVVDFLAPEVKMYGQALLDIPCYKILMGCDGKNLQETTDLYNLTDAEQELLESKRRGHALFIIGSKRLHVNFEIPAYKFSYMGKAGGRFHTAKPAREIAQIFR